MPDALDMLETMLRDARAPYEAQKTHERDRKREWRERNSLSRKCPGTQTDRDGTGTDANPHKDNYTNTRNYPDKTTLIQPAPSKHERRISRGTRLPDDFKPLPSILELARNLLLTDDEYWLAFDKFKDHFRAAPGSRGIKLDWQATWRNWVRETAERKNRNGRTSTYSKPLSISERLAGFAARLEADGEGGDSGDGENAAGLPRLRQSA